MTSKMVPESPAVKRQKTDRGYTQSTNSLGYNSEIESADDSFGNIVTTPPAMHFTQPTQIIDRSTTLSSPRSITSPEIQIPASSPFQPKPTTNMKSLPSSQKVGRLASLMAPAGTAFRSPHFNQQQHRVKKPMVIDLIDDDGPEYKGGSSDEEELSRAEIKPSTFASKSATSSFGANRSGSSNMADEGSVGGARFNEIIASSKFDLQKYKTSGISGNGYSTEDLFTSIKLSPSLKEAPDYGHETQRRPQMQSRPERATPVHVVDLTVDDLAEDEADVVTQRKIDRIERLKPGFFSASTIRNTLRSCDGSVERTARTLLGHYPKNGNDVLDDRRINPKVTEVPQMKQRITAPVAAMHERYGSTQNPKKNVQTPTTLEKKPRRRLQQGRRNRSPPTSVVQSPVLAVQELDAYSVSDDSDDSGLGEEVEKGSDLEDRLLKFINECKVEDLADLACIKIEVAATMMAHRPFKNLEAAREVSDVKITKSGKKSQKQAIGEKVVQTASDMLSGYEAVDALVAKCEELGKPLAEEIRKWGFDIFGAAKTGELGMVSLDDDEESLRDSGIGTPSSKAPSSNGEAADDDIRAPNQTRQARQTKFLTKPEIMSDDITLKDYQIVGLNWLALLYKHQLSCILADDMGLGKTCQVIAFLSHLVETGVTGPHLVIVPPSTLENWLREFQRFSPELVVDPYYGSQKERFEISDRILSERDQINVVISTYEFAAKPLDNQFMRRLKPNVCVYDEGHVLKNPKSQRYERLIRIPAQFRLLLTGTPLQNNLLELATLLGFILPEIFRNRQDQLDFIFKHKASTRDSDHSALLSGQRITRAKAMLTPFVLRRKKDQVLKHMPTKTCRVEHCDLHPSQAEVYNGLREKARERAKLRLERVKVPNDGENNPLMQLRKAAIHPMLFRRHFNDEKIAKMLELLNRHQPIQFPRENHKFLLMEMEGLSDWYLHIWCTLYPCIARFDVPDLTWLNSGKVDVLLRLLEDYKTNGDRVLIFSQFTLVLDILEAILQTSRTKFARIDGDTAVNDRQTIIDNFRDDTSITAFLLSTGAGGTGLNLMFANKVIIFDSSFNPQDDVQAENRAHRVGQTREVEVVRLVTRGTIEEQIYALGQSKLALDSKVAGIEGVHMKEEEIVAKMLLESEEEGSKGISP